MKMEVLQIFIGVAAIVVLIQTAMAANIMVGGANGGWDLNTDLQSWASSQTFAPGDALTFSFGSFHSVVEVSKTDYDACTMNNPMQAYMSGSAVIRLSSPSKRYFICGTPSHCSQGMKMEINIASASVVKSAPPAASPLIPTPTITSPPPAHDLGMTPPSTSAPPAPSPLIPTPTIYSPPPAHDLVMTPPSIPADAPMIPSEAPMAPPAAAGDATSGSAAEPPVPETIAIHSPATAGPAPEVTPGKNSGGRQVEARIMLVVSLLMFLAS